MILLFLPVIIFLTGCPLHEQVLLFNNSGSNVEVVFEEGVRILPSQSVIQISDDSEKGISWEQLIWVRSSEEGYFPILTVRCGNVSSNYNLASMYSYAEIWNKKGDTIIYMLQLEKNCDLYMLEAGSEFSIVPLGRNLIEPI